ncbi:MAG: hypothetical protein R2724_16280 [Bryobacterales bacterium]
MTSSGWTQDAGMGWNPAEARTPEVLILSTQGGIRGEDGKPIALGYHTGHFEVGLLMPPQPKSCARAAPSPSQASSATPATAARARSA